DMETLSGRTLIRSAGIGAHTDYGAATLPLAASHSEEPNALRAVFHMTQPKGRLSGRARPVYRDGTYHLYYSSSAAHNAHGVWEDATTTDCVQFSHHVAAIPLEPDSPVWSGSPVIAEDDTAGFGAGAIIALATQPTDGVRKYQEQYLFCSTDGGFT